MDVRPDGATDDALTGTTLRHTCLEAVDAGTPIAEVVCDVLAPRQAEVGEGWLRGALSVADEHRATGEIDGVIMELELRLPRTRPLRPVLCVTAEGDWHGISARMVSLVLGADGHPTEFFGPSLPAGDLARLAAATDAVVALSCSSVAALAGAARCVEAAARAGRAVIVGGHAFDAVPEALQRLGVPTAALRSATGALDAVSAPEPRGNIDERAVAELDLAEAAIGRRIAHDLDDPGASVTAQAAEHLLGFARAAICIDQPAIVRRQHPWLRAFLGARGAAVDLDHLVGAAIRAGDELLPDSRWLRGALDGD